MSFNTPIDRRGTNSTKWDKMEMLYGVSPDDGLAMWTADSDYQTAPCVIEAVKGSPTRTTCCAGRFSEFGGAVHGSTQIA